MTNAEMLAEARLAYHLLQIGRAKATVRYADRQVTYTQADKASLKAYIAELEGKERGRGTPFGVQWS